MEERACDVLRKKLGKIKDSNVDPAWLAGELFAAGIVGKNDVEKARNKGELEAERRGDLVLTMMGNGTANVFETFVDILLKKPHLQWLGKELKDEFVAVGSNESTQRESELTGVHSEEGRTKGGKATHSTSTTEFTLLNILDVLNDVGFSAAYWRELGRRLKPSLDFNAIDANYPKVERRLEEVITKWIQGGDNPSWKTLAEAVSLCNEGGGKNMALKIKQETGLV